MKKLFSYLFLILSFNAQALSETEEALILNQELQFLEDSVNTIKLPVAKQKTREIPAEENSEKSLEETYFGDSEEDSVSTRASSRKRDLE
jgi:hypothetical protein